MKKIFLLFLLIISFQIFPEGKYTETAKKATELTNEELKYKTSKLFEGIDIKKILEESANKTDKALGVDKYKEDMDKLLREIKINNLYQNFEILYIENKISYDEKIFLQNSLRELEKIKNDL